MSGTKASGTKQREPLTRPDIVRSALMLADGEGLDAVTIRRIAADHGVTHMALYWHFRNKEELLDAVAEHLFAQVELPDAAINAGADADADADEGPWDRRLLSTLAALMAVLRPHPAAAQLAPARILSSEPGLRLTDRVLGILGEAGFSGERSAAIATQLFVSIIALVTGHPGPSRQHDPHGYAAAVRERTAALTVLDPAVYPHVTGNAAPLATCADDDAYYESGLDLLVGGVSAMAARLPRP